MKLLLIGAGNMGGAMLKGLSSFDITVVEAYEPRQKELKDLYPNITIVDSCDDVSGFVVILAIKPQSFPNLTLNGTAEGLISIMAGVKIEDLKNVSAKSYIRSMPNIAALVNKSATAITGDVELKETAVEVLSSIGSVTWVDTEKDLDIATAIAGSAPAWIAMVAEALSDGAVKCGLKRDESYKFIQGLFEGMGEVLKEEHPAILKDKVTSPAGTTIAGLAKLEEGKVRDSFIKATEAAFNRANQTQ
ncbi:MAG: pyrroline-5-carboxylate reductase [Campylobacterales bacterium]|nr:pyrroline-5-carboxylate reductase [Campylobacterales bacterium]